MAPPPTSDQVLSSPEEDTTKPELAVSSTALPSAVVSSPEGDSTKSSKTINPLGSQSQNGIPLSSIAVASSPTRRLALPQFSRAWSTPSTSRLGHLRNPCRRVSSYQDPPPSPLPEHLPFHEISLELADSVQTIVQTMIQVSPPHLLDPVREQLSATSLCIPTLSVSAMLTCMKSLNYISAHMATFCTDLPEISGSGSQTPPSSAMRHEFDVGEVLQSVGDMLSGAAAHTGVDLVISHADTGMKHMSMKGDENGIAFALSHIARQVIMTARKDDTVEIGLYFTSSPPHSHSRTGELSNGDAYFPRHSPPGFDGPLRCTFEIIHKFALCSSSTDSSSFRIRPNLTTHLLRRLLRQIGASISGPNNTPDGRLYEFAIVLERCSAPTNARKFPPEPSEANLGQTEVDDAFLASEPSLDELDKFVETLKGRKVMLYASSKGSFANHLTSYLIAWGLDVSHASSDTGQEAEASTGAPQHLETEMSLPAPVSDLERLNPLENVSTSVKPESSVKPLFLLIDDDVAVLRDCLESIHAEQLQPRKSHMRKRLLSPHHRRISSSSSASSSSQLVHTDNQLQHLTSAFPSVVIIHFVSLSHYKPVKDVIQSFLASQPPICIPDVMILPKPVGPRRLLTALHTAVTRPVVDPSFVPIATSPSTLSHNGSPFFGAGSPLPSSRPTGSRSTTDRSIFSSREPILEVPNNLPSPVGVAEGMEYFPETRLGSSPSSGLVIQSPDGQPAGIFFHPKAKSPRSSSYSQGPARDRSKLFAPLQSNATSHISETQAPDIAPLNTFPSAPTFHSPSLSAPSLRPSLVPSVPPMSNASQGGKSGSSEESTHGLDDSPASQLRSPVVVQTRRSSLLPVKVGTQPASNELTDPEKNGLVRRPRNFQGGKISANPTFSSKKGKNQANPNVSLPINVLIVDDNPINQTILSAWMKKRQIKFDVAMNGLEAVEKWKSGEFHLILMDIQMPVMNGIEATKEIRMLEKLNAAAGYPPSTPSEDEDTGRTPSESPSESRSAPSPYRSSVIIVALTASSLQSDRVAALAAGCNDFLTKPVSLVWLNSKIIEWGSMKALQMWADLRPEVVRAIASEQAAQARTVARRLHVPEPRTPSRSRSNSASKLIAASISKNDPNTTSAASPESNSTARPGPSSPREGISRSKDVLIERAKSSQAPKADPNAPTSNETAVSSAPATDDAISSSASQQLGMTPG